MQPELAQDDLSIDYTERKRRDLINGRTGTQGSKYEEFSKFTKINNGTVNINGANQPILDLWIEPDEPEHFCA